MRRDFVSMLAVLLVSSGIAVAANVAMHKMDWIRRPLDPPSTTQGVTSKPLPDRSATNGGAATQPNGIVVPEADVLEHLAHGTAYFVDARETDEYAAGHLRGAINVPAGAIYANIERVTSVVAPDQLVIIYCGGGGCDASHNVADALRRDFAYSQVGICEKGWDQIEASDQFRQCIVEGEAP